MNASPPWWAVSEEGNSKGLLPMLFPGFPVTLKNTLSAFQTPEKIKASNGFYSFCELPGACRRKSFWSLPLLSSSSALQLSVADGRAWFVPGTALCQHLELCLKALGPQGSALGPVLPLHSHLFKWSTRAAPAPSRVCGLWYRLSIPLPVQFNKDVSLQNPGLLPNFLPELLCSEFILVCL